MPPALLFAPAVALILGALAGAALARSGDHRGRLAPALGAWVALAVLAASWIAVRSPQDPGGPQLGLGASLGLRLDALSFEFGCVVLLPSALLLTLQERSAARASWGALAVAGGLLVVETNGLLGAVAWLGVVVTALVIDLRLAAPQEPDPLWRWAAAAWVLLLLGATALQASGGTAVWGAIPEAAVRPATVSLVAAGGLALAGIVPWRGWPVQLWRRRLLAGPGLAVAILPAAGLYLVSRALAMGEGRFPAPWISVAVVLLGLLSAVGAVGRAQAAIDRRAFTAELVPLATALAALALGLDTQLGTVAAMAAVLSAGMVVAIAPLVPDRGRAEALLAGAVAVGVPPGLGFGAGLLVAEASLQARELYAVLAFAPAGVLITGLAAAGRAAWLPGPEPAGVERRPRVTVLLAGLGLLAGIALPALLSYVAIPAADEIAAPASEPLTAGLAGIVTASGAWPAFGLGLPLALLAAALAAGSRGAWRAPEHEPASPPAAFLPLPWDGLGPRLLEAARRFRLPGPYQSLFDPSALERAAEGSRPFLWVAVVLALAFAVTR